MRRLARRGPGQGGHKTAAASALDTTIEGYRRMMEAAVAAGARRPQDGADEAVALAETLIAVRAAKALEPLTGVDWDEHLAGRRH